MCLSKLGADILVVHINPLISKKDVLSLSAVNRALFQQLEGIRFRNSVIRYGGKRGMIINYLRPETLRTIKHLDINGTDDDLDAILESENFTGVTAVTVTNLILPDQQEAITPIACRLTELSEINYSEYGTTTNSTEYLLPGTLQNLQTFYLQNVPLPPLRRILSNSDGIAINLRSIAFMPIRFDTIFTDEHIPDGYIFEAIKFFRIIADRDFVPALRVVHVGLGRGGRDDKMKSERIAFFDELWNSAYAHGMWRLATRKGIMAPQVTPSIDGWTCWCDEEKGDLFLTTKEVARFEAFCKSVGQYPRFEDFISVNVHIVVKSTGVGVKKLDSDILAQIRGVCILPGAELKIQDGLNAVSTSSRCVLIQLGSIWGTVDGYLDFRRYEKIETLRIQHVGTPGMIDAFDEPRPYSDNLPLGVLSRLSVTYWTSLRELTVPAMALQRGDCDFTVDTAPISAICDRHIPAYTFPWLAKLASLRTFQVIELLACSECYLQLKQSENRDGGGYSFPGELKRMLPLGVTTFVLSAIVWVPSYEDMWLETVQNDIYAAVSDDVHVDLTGVWIQELDFEDDDDQDGN